MKNLLQNIQNRLSSINTFKYIDENWGQLDYYSQNLPVQWPCCLIDVQSAQYSNLGHDFSKKPNQRQLAQLTIEITVANLKLTNTSLRAPQTQKNDAWHIFELIESTHKKLHGWQALSTSSRLLRAGFSKTAREDGVQEYRIIYNIELHNV